MKKNIETVEVSFEDYNNMCCECPLHNTCHKDGIDYDRIKNCIGELMIEIMDNIDDDEEVK